MCFVRFVWSDRYRCVNAMLEQLWVRTKASEGMDVRRFVRDTVVAVDGVMVVGAGSSCFVGLGVVGDDCDGGKV
jgi:hypothetical protein